MYAVAGPSLKNEYRKHKETQPTKEEKNVCDILCKHSLFVTTDR
jgi:hypothetical protein